MTHVPSGAGAVMASRHEPNTSLDFFPTPPWATRALMEHVIGNRWQEYTAWEPACGEGHMVRPLREYFKTVCESDVHDYGGNRIHDFTMSYLPEHWESQIDWVITNPPFKDAEKFIGRGLEIATVGVAIFVRLAFVEGIGRYNNLFRPHPPSIIAQFTERVPILRGRLDKDASSATAYCWIVWRKNQLHPQLQAGQRTIFQWIQPCRRKLERNADYNTGVPPGSPSPQDTAGQTKQVSEAQNPPPPFTLEPQT